MTTPPEPHSIRVAIFKRQVVVFIALMAGGPVLIWSVGPLLFWLFEIPWRWLLWLWVLAGPLMVGGMVWWMRSIIVMRRRVRKTGGMLCPRCGYDLRDRADATLCSECGLRVTDDEIEDAWREWKKHYGSQQEQIEAMKASGKEASRKKAPPEQDSAQGS